MANEKRKKVLKVHPLCDMVPKMSAEAFGVLKTDIQKNGQMEPIWVKNGEIVDGRNRYRACRELQLTCKQQEFTGDDVETFVVSMNVARRQMSANQRGWFVKRLVALHPDHSNRSIAAMVGVSHHTVQAIRSDDSSGQSAQFKTRVGMDGKSRPATNKPPKAKPDVTTSVVDLMTSDDRDARHLMKSLKGIDPRNLTNIGAFIEQLQVQIDRLLSFSSLPALITLVKTAA